MPGPTFDAAHGKPARQNISTIYFPGFPCAIPASMKKQVFYLCCGFCLALVLALLFRLVFRTGLGWSRAEVADAYLFFLLAAAALIFFFLALASLLVTRRREQSRERHPQANDDKPPED
jgi:hypothetical protein